MGGKPLKIVELFGDTPRALAVSPDGGTVYAAVFHSGNQTSVIHESVMCRGFEDTPRGYFVGATWAPRRGNQPCIAGQMPARLATASPNGPANKTLPMGRPLPSTGADGEPAPFTAMIVKWHEPSGEWRDARGLNYSNGIRFFLPDQDVFAIDATTLQETASFRHVGTTLFNMAINPVNGMIYVANTDARNHVRFEGPGVRGGSTVQGNIARTQITVIDPETGSVDRRHLNRHIDYSVLKSSADVRRHSLSTPLELQVSADGARLYVAALGSNRIGVFATADLESDELWDGAGEEFDPTVASAGYLPVAGGPAGLLLDESRNGGNRLLYVYTHIDRGMKVIDPATGTVLQAIRFHNPEPDPVVAGRHMLYDADATSSNGESSCASCHVFGDTDHLSWNLGNPDASNSVNPQPFPTFSDFFLNCDFFGHYPGCEFVPWVNGNGDQLAFASMKGPHGHTDHARHVHPRPHALAGRPGPPAISARTTGRRSTKSSRSRISSWVSRACSAWTWSSPTPAAPTSPRRSFNSRRAWTHSPTSCWPYNCRRIPSSRSATVTARRRNSETHSSADRGAPTAPARDSISPTTAMARHLTAATAKAVTPTIPPGGFSAPTAVRRTAVKC